jgi:uncharacterized membrane protein YbjE (DUF340 family)
MSFAADIKAAKARFHIYIDQLAALLCEYDIIGPSWYDNLKKANGDPEFISRRDQIWKRILEEEGGKLSLAVILGIVGAVMGGVGIATAGSAIGLPLIALLVPLGIVLGNEMDTEGITRNIVRIVGSWFGSPNQAIQSAPAPATSDIGDAQKLAKWQERMRYPSAK